MSWQCAFHEDSQVVELKFLGGLAVAELRAAIEACREMARLKFANRVITDCTALSGGQSLVVELYDLVGAIREGSGGAFREALLIASKGDSHDFGKFWETAAQNRGMAVKSFVKRDTALDWLRQTPAPNLTLPLPLQFGGKEWESNPPGTV